MTKTKTGPAGRQAKRNGGSRCVQRLGRPLVTCHHCQGRGKLELSDELWESLEAVRALEETHATDLANHLSYIGHVTAMNNRLKQLWKLGFLLRRKEGKTYFFRPTAPHEPQPPTKTVRRP